MKQTFRQIKPEWREMVERRHRVLRWQSISTEASLRSFFRLHLAEGGSMVAMIYPEPNPEEIGRMQHLSRIFFTHGLHVPEIYEAIGDQIVLEEDAGDLLLRSVFPRSGRKKKESILRDLADCLLRLRGIDISSTPFRLDQVRMNRELSQFQQYFPTIFPDHRIDHEALAASLKELVERIRPPEVFAHRDFHSRNILVHQNRMILVDYQDSLIAPLHYDLVSLHFDAYLNLGTGRDFLLRELERLGIPIDREQYYLTALQRNIKALGTFAFQIQVRKNLKYRRSIPLTLQHILKNLEQADFTSKKALARYFLDLKTK